MRKSTDQRDAQTISLLWTSLLLFHGGDVPWWWFDLFWCHEVGCGVRWSNPVVCEVPWCVLNVVSCDVSYHVMSCDVMWRSCHLMWCAFFLLCHVTSCNVLSCDALPVIPYLKWNVQHNARSNSFTCVWGQWIWFAAMFPWHHTSHITTLPHHRSPHNSPHYFIKRHHLKAHDITT